jgi:hypothetical protein
MADHNWSAPAVRVLVVEDFEPFRRATRSILVNRSGLQIVGEQGGKIAQKCMAVRNKRCRSREEVEV